MASIIPFCMLYYLLALLGAKTTPSSALITTTTTSSLLFARARRGSSSLLTMNANNNNNNINNNNINNNNNVVSVAILGGGISGLSCASHLLSAHEKDENANYDLKVTLFDTGRLRPGGRCSSRLPKDAEKDDDGNNKPQNQNQNRHRNNGRRNGGNNAVGNTKRACDTQSQTISNNPATATDDDENKEDEIIPLNILRALGHAHPSGASSSSSSGGQNRIIPSMGPVDHAAQIISVPPPNNNDDDDDGDDDGHHYLEFQSQLQQWLEEGVVASFPDRSVCELFNEQQESGKVQLQPIQGSSTTASNNNNNMYYGVGGMGSIPIAMREYCHSFNNKNDSTNDDDYGSRTSSTAATATATATANTAAATRRRRKFQICQDVWVSPSNGVKYIGTATDTSTATDTTRQSQLQWELRANNKSLGKYHKLVVAHNGKCADRIMSKTPATKLHSLLRTKFAPYVPPSGGKEMTLNSIYSLVFAVRVKKNNDVDVCGAVGGGGGGGGVGAIDEALKNLNNNNDGNSALPYTVMIKNEPNLRLLSCNTRKHNHKQTNNNNNNNNNSNSNTSIQVWTLLSSPHFGKQYKGPQENLPPALMQTVTMELLTSLERALHLKEGSVVETVVDAKLQLWGAAVPMNTWQSQSNNNNNNNNNNGGGGKGKGVDGYLYDAKYGVGVCGDWILDPSIAGAWESGRRLAQWMIDEQQAGVDGKRNSNDNAGSEEEEQWSIGLPQLANTRGRFVPSRAASESGIGTIPSSPNVKSIVPPPPPPTPRSNNGKGGSGSNGAPRNKQNYSRRPNASSRGGSNGNSKNGNNNNNSGSSSLKNGSGGNNNSTSRSKSTSVS